MKLQNLARILGVLVAILAMGGASSAQSPDCSSLNAFPSFFEFPSFGGPGSVSVNAPFGCSWSASCTGAALAFGGGGGTGFGSFNFSANANPTSGTIGGSCSVSGFPNGFASVTVIVDPPSGGIPGPTGLGAVLQYQAQDSAIHHVIGQPASNGAWSVSFPGSQNWLSYGPYVTIPTAGDYVAAWNLSIDNNTRNLNAIGNIDVNDASTQTEIATRQPVRNEWKAINTYQTMTLPFTVDSSRAGHQFEFRMFWFDEATTRELSLGFVPLQWNAQNTALGHLIGRPDGGGWSAGPLDGQSWLQYGPYTNLSSGNYVALWTLQVDNNTADNTAVAIVDVNDATTQTRLQSLQVLRRQFHTPFKDQVFQLPFSIDASRSGHQFEFRLWYTATSFVREQAVGVVATP